MTGAAGVERGAVGWAAVDRAGASRWRLAGAVTSKFADKPQFVGMPRWALRPLFWLQLGVVDYRADPAGTAVLCLGGASSAPRVKAGVVGVLGAAVLLAVELVAWPVAAVLVAALVWVYLPIVRTGLRDRAARRVLRRARPAGPHVVVVHTVASVEPPAGARLLAELNTEADGKGWTLVLDAANVRLADYYTRLGYLATSHPVRMSSGELSVPMVRRPDRGGKRL